VNCCREALIDTAVAAPWLPFVTYALVVLAVTAGMLVVSFLLGERHRAAGARIPYESGMLPTGGTRSSFPVHFYLVALSFLIFDLEAAFIFAWAVSARDLGWPGYVGVAVFIVVLTVTLVYEWRLGAFRSPARGRRSQREAGQP
jgi:NADH-quinone oxidoreductase subunit A